MKSFFYKTILPLTLIALTLASYYYLGKNTDNITTETKSLLDTMVTIKTVSGNRSFNEEAFAIMEKIEKLGEWHHDDSQINKVIAGTEKAPGELKELIDESLQYAKMTDGAFDPTVKTLVELWSIGNKDYLPQKTEVSTAMASVGYRKLGKEITDQEIAKVDLGGILKGKAIDRAAERLQQNKVSNFLISTISSTKTSGNKGSGKPWLVGIENPRQAKAKKSVIAVLELSGKYSVSTSGDYQRFFMKGNQRFSHILDPKTGYPADKAISVTVVTKRSAAFADAMSTAIFVMGYPDGLRFAKRLSETEVLIVDKKGRIHTSKGMPALLKSSEKSIYN